MPVWLRFWSFTSSHAASSLSSCIIFHSSAHASSSRLNFFKSFVDRRALLQTLFEVFNGHFHQFSSVCVRSSLDSWPLSASSCPSPYATTIHLISQVFSACSGTFEVTFEPDWSKNYHSLSLQLLAASRLTRVDSGCAFPLSVHPGCLDAAHPKTIFKEPPIVYFSSPCNIVLFSLQHPTPCPLNRLVQFHSDTITDLRIRRTLADPSASPSALIATMGT